MSFDPNQVKHLATYEAPGILFGLCFDAAGNIVYGAGTDGAIYRVDLSAKQPESEPPEPKSGQKPADKPAAKLTAEKMESQHDNYVSSLVWLQGTIISSGFDRRLIWTDAASGKQVRTVDAHAGWVREVVAFPDGQRLASVGDDMLVKIWNAETGELLQSLGSSDGANDRGHAKQTPQGFATALYCVAVSPDGQTLASADRIGEVCLWEAESGKLLQRIQAPTFYTYDAVKRSRSLGGIRSVTFSPDGSQIAISGIGVVTNVDGFVGPCRTEVWDWQSGQRVLAGQGKHQAVLNHVQFHPTEPWLAAAGGGDSGGVLAFWKQPESKSNDTVQPQHMVKPKGHVQRFVWTEDRIFLAGHGGLQVWAST